MPSHFMGLRRGSLGGGLDLMGSKMGCTRRRVAVCLFWVVAVRCRFSTLRRRSASSRHFAGEVLC